MIFNLISYIFSGDRTSALYALITLLLRIPAILLALSIHESAHGWMANKLGDPTAKNLGRLTINPMKHLDPIGTISMLFFGIGWAKPVPVNSRYFKKPKRDMALTAAAGPLSNLLQGFVATLLMFIGTRFLLGRSTFATALDLSNEESLFSIFIIRILSGGSLLVKISGIILYLLFIYATLNFVLAFFNLIPIPPFDGSRLAFVLLPDKIYFGIMKYERYIMLAFLLFFFFFSGIFSTVFEVLISLFFKAFAWVLIL